MCCSHTVFSQAPHRLPGPWTASFQISSIKAIKIEIYSKRSGAVCDLYSTYLRGEFRLVVCCAAGWAWTLKTLARSRFGETAFRQSALVQQSVVLIMMPGPPLELLCLISSIRIFVPETGWNLFREFRRCCRFKKSENDYSIPSYRFVLHKRTFIDGRTHGCTSRTSISDQGNNYEDRELLITVNWAVGFCSIECKWWGVLIYIIAFWQMV